MEMVGERIKNLRKELGWTQSFLAKKVNVSPQVVSNWERRYTDPDHDDITRLSKVFEVSTDYLLGRTDAKIVPKANTTNDQAMNDVIREYNRLPPHKRKVVDDLIKMLQEGTD